MQEVTPSGSECRRVYKKMVNLINFPTDSRKVEENNLHSAFVDFVGSLLKRRKK